MARHGFGSCDSNDCSAERAPRATFFLPAERATGPEVRRQASLFDDASPAAALLGAVPVGVIILNQQRQVVYANDAFRKLSGRAENVIGLRLGETLLCEHGGAEPAGCGTTPFCTLCGAAQVTQIARQGDAAMRECRIDRQPDAPGDPALDLRVWSQPMSFGQEQFLLLALQDIGDEKRRQILEHHLLDIMGAGLEEIQGLAGLLQVVGDAAPDHGSALLKAIEDTASRLLEGLGVHELLLGAERGILNVTVEGLRTRPFLRRLVKSLAEEAAIAGLNLRLDPAAVDLLVVTDGLLLEEVLTQMIRNGLEAEEAGAKITVGCEAAGGDVRFWVHNPTPMSRQVQLQVFQRSFSTRGTGRGVGTYMMKLLSERYLDGVVTFISTRRDGTIFSALYPRRLQGSSEKSVSPSSEAVMR